MEGLRLVIGFLALDLDFGLLYNLWYKLGFNQYLEKLFRLLETFISTNGENMTRHIFDIEIAFFTFGFEISMLA